MRSLDVHCCANDCCRHCLLSKRVAHRQRVRHWRSRYCRSWRQFSWKQVHSLMILTRSEFMQLSAPFHLPSFTGTTVLHYLLSSMLPLTFLLFFNNNNNNNNMTTLDYRKQKLQGQVTKYRLKCVSQQMCLQVFLTIKTVKVKTICWHGFTFTKHLPNFSTTCCCHYCHRRHWLVFPKITPG